MYQQQINKLLRREVYLITLSNGQKELADQQRIEELCPFDRIRVVKPITVCPPVIEESPIVWETSTKETIPDDEEDVVNCIIGYHESPKPTRGTFGHGAGIWLRPQF